VVDQVLKERTREPSQERLTALARSKFVRQLAEIIDKIDGFEPSTEEERHRNLWSTEEKGFFETNKGYLGKIVALRYVARFSPRDALEIGRLIALPPDFIADIFADIEVKKRQYTIVREIHNAANRVSGFLSNEVSYQEKISRRVVALINAVDDV
jgi:hypothetical protein